MTQRPGPGRELRAAILVIVACLLWRAVSGSMQANAKPPRAAGAPTVTAAAPTGKGAASPAPADRVMAMVNTAEITQPQLAAECLSRHGNAALEAMVNREIISQACGRRGITITSHDVDAEIDAMAKRFSVPRDKWISLIQQERGVSPKQYSEDIVWPMLALRRLAHAGIEPTAEEVQQSFENQFGEAVKARIIVDLTGLALAPALAHFAVIRDISVIGKKYFPESTLTTTVVNAPWAFARLFAIVAPLLTPVQRRKIRVLDTDFAAGLEDHSGLRLEALPRFLGGDTPDSQCPVPERAAAVLAH
jgi:hypothetical protein